MYSWYGDFIGMLKRLQDKKKKIVLKSSPIKTFRFSAHASFFDFMNGKKVACIHWLNLRCQQSLSEAIEIRGVPTITKDLPVIKEKLHKLLANISE